MRAYATVLRDMPRKLAVRAALWALKQPQVYEFVETIAMDHAAHACSMQEEELQKNVDGAIEDALNHFTIHADSVEGFEDAVQSVLDDCGSYITEREAERSLENMADELRSEIAELKSNAEEHLDEIRAELGVMVRDAAISAIVTKLAI